MNTTSTNMLYLIRHGENPANITHEFSYKLVDYSLTPRGVLQAEQTAEFFKERILDAIYSSPLKRAHETANLIAESHQLPVTVLEGLREINVGELELIPPSKTAWQLHDEIIAQWFTGKLDATFPGGENFLELLKRTRDGLLEATRKRENQHIAIVAHGGCITALVRSICPDASHRLSYANMYNCAITTLELTTCGHEMRGSLRSWASATHLSGEAAPQATPVLISENVPR